MSTPVGHPPTQHPAQVQLPHQAAAPEGPVDLVMMYVMHHGFRRDLASFEEAVAATPIADRRTWRALADRWDRFSTLLYHHHEGEDDGLWPLLVERAHPKEVATLAAMEEEHGQIDPLLDSIAAGFATLRERGDSDERAALLVRVTAARELVGRHLAHEEADAMPILQRHLTQEDWGRIERDHFARKTSLADLAFAVPWCAKAIPTRQRDEVFRRVGGPAKVIWRLSRRWFDRREAVAFRYA